MEVLSIAPVDAALQVCGGKKEEKKKREQPYSCKAYTPSFFIIELALGHSHMQCLDSLEELADDAQGLPLLFRSFSIRMLARITYGFI